MIPRRLLLSLAATLLIAVPTSGQRPRNQVSLSVADDLNPVTQAQLTAPSPPETLISRNRSALGGMFEYQRWTGNVAIGAFFEANPSDGHLFDGQKNYIWPLLNMQTGLLATERITRSKESWWFQEGNSVIMSQSLVRNSGFSWDFGLAGGVGVDYTLSHRWALRAGEKLLLNHTGCYDGRQCNEQLRITQDPEIGVVFGW